jgi:hypothetical protein
MNTDLTGVRFSDKARWGEENTIENRFKIVDYFIFLLSY